MSRIFAIPALHHELNIEDLYNMVRYTGPRNRIARKFGANLFNRRRNPLLHKQGPPGSQGTRRRKKSDFGQQLEEKQKLKALYGMLTEKQLVRYFHKALKTHGPTALSFIRQLECRLDSVIYRLKFASTPFAAQQLVSHGHIMVDERRVDIRSFQVLPGMRISVHPKARKIATIKQSLEDARRDCPEYLELNIEQFSGQLHNLPEMEQIPFPISVNVPVVCEFLAHNT